MSAIKKIFQICYNDKSRLEFHVSLEPALPRECYIDIYVDNTNIASHHLSGDQIDELLKFLGFWEADEPED